MADFDKGRRRFTTTFGMLGWGLCLPVRTPELPVPPKKTTKTMKRKLARSKT
jgi:hypothetical protein